jgi:benzoyl-CoA-dihydrodiol lyase
VIEFRTSLEEYRHWKLSVDGSVARLAMDVAEDGGLGPYELKMNSYDLGVDIELYDAVQRLRFEHPEVGAVLIESLKERVFCSGANITMLAESTHALKVNFCKFTNETRNAIEDATDHSGQRYLAAINGTAAGGGYELALACDTIILIDDGAASVALPEVPLLGVLPATGGLTRLVDKRGVRRDHADILCTTEEGVKGTRALEWHLVDHLAPGSRFEDVVAERLAEAAATTERPAPGAGITMDRLERRIDGDRIEYPYLAVTIDRDLQTAEIEVSGPLDAVPDDADAARTAGVAFWPLAVARALDDALLHLRVNELEVGTFIIRSSGSPDLVAAYDRMLHQPDHWFVREVVLYLKRTFKRLDVTSRSTIALIEPGSCFVGFLCELVLAADRSYMTDGTLSQLEGEAPQLTLTEANLGLVPMGNGLSRLETRFWGRPEDLEIAKAVVGRHLEGREAEEAGLITFALDEIDWDEEIRLALEERASFSPDSLSGMEANLRFVGPETMETKIFGRLSAWQNWVFQRPNAAGEAGALRRYGTGRRPEFDRERV